MKKLALVMIVALVGCNERKPVTIESNEGAVYEITIIDGCQYIEMGSSTTHVITHKGNCNNPIHKIKDLENKD